SGATITYSAGPAVTGCNTVTTGLTTGNYNGNISFSTDTGLSGTMTIILSVGTSGGTAGLTYSPNPVTFNLTSAQVVPQNVSIFFNGSLATIQNVSSSTTTANWLSVVNTGSLGVIQVT